MDNSKIEQALRACNLINLRNIYSNLGMTELIEEAVLRKEGRLSAQGALVVETGKHSGRAPNDKFIVDNGEDDIAWGKINKPISPDHYQRLYDKCCAYLQGKDVFVQDLAVGAHPDFQISVRIISEKASAGLFSSNLLIKLDETELNSFSPDFHVIHCPELHSNPDTDGTRSETFVVVNYKEKVVIIGNTGYAGEIKKSMFSVMNYLLPQKDVMAMHCSANIGKNRDVALFFGLSGTGKTTLSSDPNRRLIGDDEHGWSNGGIFNFEGGCYAKTIKLSSELEPIIWDASQRFGTLLENVMIDTHTRIPDFDDNSLTENTRAGYPLTYVKDHVPEGYGGHPKNIFFLTADAFGVLPPLSKLTKEQAIYYFLSGYTSKLAGTEVGLGKEPVATFSTCFGEPFMPMHPTVYARLLGEKIDEHKANVWLINTGWTGGGYGEGKRIDLPYTRAMVQAALNFELDDAAYHQEEIFGFWIPDSCPHVPEKVLNPVLTWDSEKHYYEEAIKLRERFAENFKQYEAFVEREILEAGPAR